MSYTGTQQSGPLSLEDRVTALEENAEKNNKNLTDTLKKLVTTLNEARDEECKLPPFCVEPENPGENE